MTDEFLKEVHGASSLHRVQVERSDVCGCFYCTRMFQPSAIVEWTDDDTTALCPHCGIDSVLPSMAGFELSPELLKAMRWKYFL